MRGKVGLLRSIIRIITVVLVCLSLSLCVLLLVKFILAARSNVSSDGEYSTYRYYQTNPTTNMSTSGFLTIRSQHIPDEGIVQYSGDSLLLISNFGTTEYECWGRCSCEESSHREGSFNSSEGERFGHYQFSKSHVVSKGMTYLVSARANDKAVSLSDEYFKGECEKMCPENSVVKTEVIECMTVKEKEEKERLRQEKLKLRQEELKKEQEKLEEEWERQTSWPFGRNHFNCVGKCLQRVDKLGGVFSKASDYMKNLFGSDSNEKKGRGIECNLIELSATVFSQKPKSGAGEEEKKEEEDVLVAAKYRFTEKLHDYCRRNSFGDQEDFQCVGRKNGINPTVDCVEMGW